MYVSSLEKKNARCHTSVTRVHPCRVVSMTYITNNQNQIRLTGYLFQQQNQALRSFIHVLFVLLRIEQVGSCCENVANEKCDF